MIALRTTRRVAFGLLFGLPWLVAEGAEPTPDLTGTWTWSWKDGKGTTHRHVLEVEGTGAKLAARERFDDLTPVKINDLKVVGKKVNFSVIRGARTSTYTGTMTDADTINGDVQVSSEGRDEKFTWTAKREQAKKS